MIKWLRKHQLKTSEIIYGFAASIIIAGIIIKIINL